MTSLIRHLSHVPSLYHPAASVHLGQSKQCCSCTCEDARYVCGEDGFACIDPDAECVDDDDIDEDNVGCFQHAIGDSYCDTANNIPACGAFLT